MRQTPPGASTEAGATGGATCTAGFLTGWGGDVYRSPAHKEIFLHLIVIIPNLMPLVAK